MTLAWAAARLSQVRETIPDAEKKSTSVYRERLYHEITKNKREAKLRASREAGGGVEDGAVGGDGAPGVADS